MGKCLAHSRPTSNDALQTWLLATESTREQSTDQNIPERPWLSITNGSTTTTRRDLGSARKRTMLARSYSHLPHTSLAVIKTFDPDTEGRRRNELPSVRDRSGSQTWDTVDIIVNGGEDVLGCWVYPIRRTFTRAMELYGSREAIKTAAQQIRTGIEDPKFAVVQNSTFVSEFDCDTFRAAALLI
ncbi:uncharacterized protein N7515_002064 [Penicillium bovifimosum]|uniref:Uncharacterized protein n=1 Tax=Penicillium bovifimosum TaxID=126998 RepID=A0A9W9HAV6_9EURO|nr:uncharacterized protein N7515_002064 [Penicillium bovifimosum]KAJ5143277.1 hypothetical protein N7515_002064 [Penicillium bovifimosum]